MKAGPINSPVESEARWAGDPNAEWMNLAVAVAGIGTWEFDLNQGTGFVSQRCSEIMGFSGASESQLVRFEDWLAMLPWQDRYPYSYQDQESEQTLKRDKYAWSLRML